MTDGQGEQAQPQAITNRCTRTRCGGNGTSGVTSTVGTVRKAVLKALERFIIAAADTVMSRSNAQLVAEVFPEVTVTGDLGEHDTLLSIEKARRVLGYSPQHSWR